MVCSPLVSSALTAAQAGIRCLWEHPPRSSRVLEDRQDCGRLLAPWGAADPHDWAGLLPPPENWPTPGHCADWKL